MVTDAFRELITDGQISPGTPLRQRQLVEQFDVSYTPVREPLRRLESEGLVVIDVHRGALVSQAESDEVEENFRILAALESLAGSIAVTKMTDEDMAEIEDLYQQVAACDPNDGQLAELNRRFHFRVYECARSPMLLLLMRLLWRSFSQGPQHGRPHRESSNSMPTCWRRSRTGTRSRSLPSSRTTCSAASRTCAAHGCPAIRSDNLLRLGRPVGCEATCLRSSRLRSVAVYRDGRVPLTAPGAAAAGAARLRR